MPSLSVKQISAGYYHTCAIADNDQVYCWGLNDYGQLGDGTTENRHVPTQIGTDSNWRSVAVGDGALLGRHTFAIRTDGTLWAWGRNNIGNLGIGVTTHQHSPVQVGTATNWRSVAASGGGTKGIHEDGTMWAWGGNSGGALGDGTHINRYVPTQIGIGTDWQTVTRGSGFSIATCVDGFVWSWGFNSTGVLASGRGYAVMNPPSTILVAVPSPTNTMFVDGLPQGVTVQSPLFIDANGMGELTLLIDETAQAGTHDLTLFIRGVKSNEFTFTINHGVDPTPTITINTHPADVSVVYGEIGGELYVSASATYGATLSYQWFSNTTASNTGGTAIPNSNSATFAIPSNLPNDSTHFFYVVVSAVGAESVTSNVATVTVGFGNIPPTGIPSITALIAAMFALFAISVVLWGFVLHHKPRRNNV
jgi:hypothetical protein